MEGYKKNVEHMGCPYCDKRKVKFFSVYGRRNDGFTALRKYTSCKECLSKLVDETIGKPAKVLPLKASIIALEFADPDDQKLINDFVKMMLGL